MAIVFLIILGAICLALGPLGIILILLYLGWGFYHIKNERNKPLHSNIDGNANPISKPVPIESKGLDLADLVYYWILWELFK